jgi:hypothetical protein
VRHGHAGGPLLGGLGKAKAGPFIFTGPRVIGFFVNVNLQKKQKLLLFVWPFKLGQTKRSTNQN